MPTYSCFQAFQTLPKINQFRGCDKDDVQFLNNNARKFKVLDKLVKTVYDDSSKGPHILFLKDLGESAIYFFRVEIQTELPNDETPSSL